MNRGLASFLVAGLFAVSLMIFAGTTASLEASSFCDSVSDSVCTISSQKRLNDTFNFSGTVSFEEGANLTDGGKIYADEFQGMDNLDLKQGDKGNFYLCEREKDVNCEPRGEKNSRLISAYGVNSSRFLFRDIKGNWTPGYLNWTDDFSKTSELNSSFTDLDITYTAGGLTENTEFKVFSDESSIKKVNSGVNFSSYTDEKFKSDSRVNITGTESLSLEASGSTDSNINDPGERQFIDGEFTNYFRPTKDVIVIGVNLFSDYSDDEADVTLNYSYEIRELSSQDIIVDSFKLHKAHGFETDEIEPIVLESGKDYSITYSDNNSEKLVWYGDFGTVNNINWYDSPTGGFPHSGGLEILDSYEEKGTYTSSPKNAGEVVDWNSSIIENTTSADTEVTVEYAENSSGSWNFYDSLEQLPETQFLKYRLNLSTNDTTTSPIVDSARINYNPPGEDGLIKFERNLSGSSSFRLLETNSPTYNSVTQEKDVMGAKNENELSVNIQDKDSGVRKAVLATDESGSLKNRSEYIKEFNNSFEEKKAAFSWSNNSFEGGLDTVEWQIWIRDSAGNWNSTPLKSFSIDGIPPSITSLEYPNIVDVDETSPTITFDVTENQNSIKTVKVQENSTGNFRNSSNLTQPYSYQINRQEPGEVNFTVFAEDTVDNVGNKSGKIKFQNITISQQLNNSKINSSEKVDVSGTATLQPYGTPLTSAVEIWAHIGEWKKLTDSNLESDGSYSAIEEINKPGTHQIRVNMTENGVSGRAEADLDVLLDINNASATFESTGNSHVDKDTVEKNLNLTANITRPVDGSIDSVKANVSLPNGTYRTFDLGGSGNTWYKSIDTDSKFGDLTGEYTVTYSANTTENLGSNLPKENFYIENVSVTSELGDSVIRINEEVNFNGNVTLQPYQENLDGTLEVWNVSNQEKLSSFQVNSGDYSGSLSFQKPRNRTLKFNYTDSKGIKGASYRKVSVLNLTATIENYDITSRKGKVDNQVFRNGTISFEDNVTADLDNPLPVFNTKLKYQHPDRWTRDPYNSDIGKLQPGESGENSPTFDIDSDARLGHHQINITTDTREDIVSKDSTSIEVWSKSESDYLNLAEGDVLNREKDFYNISAEVTDLYSGEELSGINTSLIIANYGRVSWDISNSSGKVELPINLSMIGTGTDFTASVITSHNTSGYVNSSEDPFDPDTTVSFNVQGKMQPGENKTIRAVYRQSDITPIEGQIEDSTGSPLSNAKTYLEINGTVIGPENTGDSGYYNYSYEPRRGITPGVYNATINASKDEFADLEFNRSVEVRGELSVSNLVDRNIVQRGLQFEGVSHVVNEFGEKTSGNVSWHLNSTEVGSAENTTINVPTGLERGSYDLKVSTNREFFDDDSSVKSVDVYGLADVELKPEDFTIRPGNAVDFTATVTDSNTSSEIEDYPVKFEVDGNTYTRMTDSSGVASLTWTPDTGNFEMQASISDNASLNYNVSDATDSTDIEAKDKLYLDEYSFSNKDIYRYFKTPYRTVFNINLTRNSDTINRVPVTNEKVEFTINGSQTISCTTDATGACNDALIYDPGSEVSAGNLTVHATTDRPDWIDINRNNSLIVRGQLITTLNSPGDDTNLARGDNISLSATTDTLVGGQVERNLSWKINGETVATGYDTYWEIPTDESTGEATLEAKGDGEYFASDTDSVNVWILGNAAANLVSPANDSAIGYAEPVTVTCEVTSQGNTIDNYPVEFVENSSGNLQVFSTAQTENSGNGYQATTEWQPPEDITSVKTGCRIDDNRTVGYTAEKPLDTRIYETKDDSPPELSFREDLGDLNNITIPGETAEIYFNASDERGIEQIDTTVYDPAFAEVSHSISEVGDTGYLIEVNTPENTQGTYQVEITVSDPSGNSQSIAGSFDVQPSGDLTLGTKTLTAEAITEYSGLTESVEVNFTKLEESGTDVTLKTSSNTLNFDQTQQLCGDMAAGESCIKTFDVTVPSGTDPTENSPLYGYFRANWSETDTTIGDFIEINVESNPVLTEETSNREVTVSHKAGAINLSTLNPQKGVFKSNSSGNTPVEDFRAVFVSGDLRDSWVTLYNNQEDSLTPRTTIGTEMEIDIPEGTSPTGNDPYNGTVEFRSSNYDTISRSVEVDVRTDANYTTTDSVSASAVKESSGKVADIWVNSSGNVDLNLIPEYSSGAGDSKGLCAKGLEIENEPVSLEKLYDKKVGVYYNFTENSPSGGSCTPEIIFGAQDYNSSAYGEKTEFTLQLLDFTIDVSQEFSEAYPGDRRSLSFQTSIGDENRTDNISFDVLVGGVPARNITSENSSDRFHVNYTVPEVPDARYHDVTVVAEDLENGVENSKSLKDKIYVPDFSPPHFGNFNIQGVDPGETQEIEVPVSDNSGTVENVSMRLEGPVNESNYSLSKVTGEEKWSVSIPDVEKGVYRANFTAYDPSGFSSSVVDTFRVSSNTTFDGSFTTPDGGANSGADLVFTDSETSRSVPVNIGGSGSYSVDLKEGNYDVTAEFDGQQVNMENTPVNENTSGFRAEELTEVETSGLTPSDSTAERVMGIGVDTGLEPESATITFNYSGVSMPSGYEISELEVARCPDYNYGSLTCDSSSFETFEVGRLDVNKARKTITVEVSGFSSYTLFAPAEGSNESDEPDQPDDSGGGGGGGGGLGDAFEDLNESVSETQEEVENLSERLNDTETPGAELGSSSINAELRPGEQKTVSLSVSNTANDSQTFVFGVDEIISDYVSVSDTVTLESGESRDVLLNISAPADELAGSYSGTLSIESDEINTNIPVNVQVLPPQDKLLDMSLNPVFSSVEPGDALQVEATFSNQGYARNVDVTAVIDVLDPDTNKTIASLEETVAVGTTLNRVFEIDIPEDTSLKSYAIRGSARYTNLDVSRVATAASSFEVDQPFWSRDIFGFTYGNIALGFLLLLLVSAIGFSIYYYRRKQALKKKRYMENIDLDTIPSGGDNQAYIGELAEVGTRTFLELDDLTTHALIAGATGSGKTVTGQVMVEEALEKGANVIVLDPTAQWTGYLRENKDQNMLELYDDYGMRQSDARAFDGNIRAVEPEEDIDITPYLEQDEDGQIIIFSLHKLDSKNIDEFANNTIQQIFDANLPERDGLETIIVYDEVHRLLEKFGGNGEGLKQLERGAREFRKWGVGMVLLSQVISDFSGEIRANIGTTIQMRTQYDDDLERIREKFGIDTVKSIAKAEVGSGMLQNSDYNHGRPYFVDFRPLLHSPHRLSDEELEKYEDYNKRVDAIEEKVDQLEEQGEDVYEYRSELKLTKRNLKKGSFSLVDTYIEELEEKLDI